MKRTGSVAALLLLAAAARAQAPAQAPGPEHRKLEALVGEWTMEGAGKDGPTSQEHKVVGALHDRWILSKPSVRRCRTRTSGPARTPSLSG